MDRNMNQEMSDHGKMLYEFTGKEGRKLGKHYGMSICGVGGSAKEDGISEMAVSFQRFGDPLTESEARRLIIKCVDDFLEAVNTDEAIRPFLKVYPFNAENIDLTIYSYDNSYVLHRFPYIGVVENSNGKIGLFTKEKSVVYEYKTEKYETYEEAVAILQKECEEQSK